MGTAEPVVTLREHVEAVLALRDRLDDERDRRYTEVSAARAEALKIKEAGDAKALELAREIQTYKDEKANELREQINSERGLYATKAEIAPLTAFVLAQQGGSKVWMVILTVTLAAAAIVAANVFQ